MIFLIILKNDIKIRYKNIGHNIDLLRQRTCLVANPINLTTSLLLNATSTLQSVTVFRRKTDFFCSVITVLKRRWLPAGEVFGGATLIAKTFFRSIICVVR